MMGGGGIFDAIMKSMSEISIGDEEYRKGEGSVISSLRNNCGSLEDLFKLRSPRLRLTQLG